MAAVYSPVENRNGVDDYNLKFQVHFWRCTNKDISIVNAVKSDYGTNVTNWPSTCKNAVNGPFFPNKAPNNVVNSFAINNSAAVLTTGSDTDGSKNFEDIDHLANPLDFLMDPKTKTSAALCVVGNGGKFPITNALNSSSYQTSDINWGLGGMDLAMGNSSFDIKANFDKNWKWKVQMKPEDVSYRTAIGFLGGSTTETNYIVAAFTPCRMFDVRQFFKDKEAKQALYLDGGGSTAAKNNGTIVVSQSRLIPVIVSMA